MSRKSKLKKQKPYVWLIVYISEKTLELAERDLSSISLDIKLYVPKIRILQKEFKGKKVYRYVPLMFNYGFLKVPFRYACSKEKLEEIRTHINCILGYLRDPSLLHESEECTIGKYKLDDNIAIVSSREILRMVEEAESHSIFEYNSELIKVGRYITLIGYPYEGVPAQILKVDEENEKVKVRLELDITSMEIEIAFDNVYYTVYRTPNATLSNHDSLDEMIENSYHKIDRIYANLEDN